MLDNATLKLLLAAVLAIFLLFKMSRGWTRDGFAPFAWYGYEGGEAPGEWGTELAAKGGPKNNTKQSAMQRAAKGTAMAPLAASADLLPKRAADEGFAQFAPDPAALTGQNFVDASGWVSMGTLGVHRNANYQLRADIPIPKNNKISPWLNSTIEQDTYRKPLE